MPRFWLAARCERVHATAAIIFVAKFREFPISDFRNDD